MLTHINPRYTSDSVHFPTLKMTGLHRALLNNISKVSGAMHVQRKGRPMCQGSQRCARQSWQTMWPEVRMRMRTRTRVRRVAMVRSKGAAGIRWCFCPNVFILLFPNSVSLGCHYTSVLMVPAVCIARIHSCYLSHWYMYITGILINFLSMEPNSQQY